MGATAPARQPGPTPKSTAQQYIVSTRDRWLISAPFGAPVVPEVYWTTKGSVSGTWAAGATARAAPSASAYVRPTSVAPSVSSSDRSPATSGTRPASASSATSARAPD